MPIIYLSPSTQEYNEYVSGLGNEEEWMNRLADAMEPMLFASGIQYTRNTPDMTAASSIRASNAGNYNLHPVSYTHLDVYKRQGTHRGEIFPGAAGSGLAGIPASLAALRLILEASLCIEFLLSSGEHELVAALFAY